MVIMQDRKRHNVKRVIVVSELYFTCVEHEEKRSIFSSLDEI